MSFSPAFLTARVRSLLHEGGETSVALRGSTRARAESRLIADERAERFLRSLSLCILLRARLEQLQDATTRSVVLRTGTVHGVVVSDGGGDGDGDSDGDGNGDGDGDGDGDCVGDSGRCPVSRITEIVSLFPIVAGERAIVRTVASTRDSRVNVAGRVAFHLRDVSQ